MRGKVFSDEQLIDGIISRKAEIIEYLYIKNKPKILRYIISKGGLKQDAEDAFHEGLLNVFIKLKEKTIKSNIEGYLFIACKNFWLIEQQNNNKENKLKTEYLYHQKIDSITEPNNRVNKKIFKALKELPNDCKKIFILQRKGYSYSDISENFEITLNSLKTKRARCIKQLNSILTTNNNGK